MLNNNNGDDCFVIVRRRIIQSINKLRQDVQQTLDEVGGKQQTKTHREKPKQEELTNLTSFIRLSMMLVLVVVGAVMFLQQQEAYSTVM